ncbi:5595_t:CDS:2, partial [Diversispora eburnea]
KESSEKGKEKELENKLISEEIITEEEDEIPKFTPEEIEKLVNLANNCKLNGNEYFSKSKYEEAIKEYEKALDTCPIEKKDERAIYWGNIGTCYVKLGKLKEAVDAYNKYSPSYTKVLFRRAQANEKLHTLTSLTSALEDRKSINSSIQRLPPLISQQQEKEKDEVIGKLKDLGNRFLGNFGLSTDNFKMVQDPNSGGYNVQFVNNSNQGNDGSGSNG